MPREHSGRDARVDTTDLVKLGAGTVQHARVDVGLALHDERQLAILVCMDVHLGALVMLAPLALNHDIVVVLADHGRIDSIDDCLGNVLIEVAHGCPHLPPCVLLGEVLLMKGGDPLNVDAVRFGQVVRGEGRHALVVLLWIVYHESEILEHLIQFIGVDASSHPTHTVRGHLPEPIFQARDESIVGCVVLGDGVHRFIVLQPQGDVPRFVVCPTVEGLGCFDDFGLHSVWFVCLCVL